MSRIKNTSKNLITGAGGQLLVIVMTFVTRTVFINTLGKEFLGVNGLFTNIISMLSLAELGVGSAITFNLYKPLATNDTYKINLLMNFYKKAYTIIGLIISLLGLATIPLLPYLIKDDIKFININFIFILYLFQSVSSYLFYAYKSALIKADQKEYVITKIEYLFTIITNIVQIVILITFKNFSLYVITIILFNFLKYLVIAHKADKMYPFIKEKSYSKIEKSEVKYIVKNCSAIFIYKINGVVLSATDNIVLSGFIGLGIVGIYSNYLMITKAIKNILLIFFNAVAASLGNLHASSNADHEYFIFKTINLISFWLFGIASIGIYVVANDFILYWIGKEYLISQNLSLLLATDIYLYGQMRTVASFRVSMGLFQEGKYRPIFGIIINIVLSLVLVNYLGIFGVVSATIIANSLTYVWFDPYIIHKHGFKRTVKKYYFLNIIYALTTLFAGSISYFLSKMFLGKGILYLLLNIAICVIIPSLVFYLLYGKTKEFKYILQSVEKIIKRKT